MPYKDPNKQKESRSKWKALHPEYMKEYSKTYRERNKERISAYNKQYDETYKDKRKSLYLLYKNKFFEMYGDVCVCCGENKKEFLTLEHKNGQRGKKKDSWAYRKATSVYQPDLYETLCWNCNCAKGLYGVCPHQI